MTRQQQSKLGIGAAMGVTAVAAFAATTLIRNLAAGEPMIRRRVAHRFGVRDEQFERAMGQLLGPPILDGNRVEALQNGDAFYPAMLDAIEKAEETITFETFVFWEGAIAEKFVEALAAKARRGVAVHVLLDALGCDCSGSPLLDRLVDAGAQLELYHMADAGELFRYNNRTHRKLMVIDGKVGFTGGPGIADVWRGDARKEHEWRDTFYRIEGPVVAQIQSAFMDNWINMHAEVLHGREYFPPLSRCGESRCQMFRSGPEEGSESARMMYHLAIASAERSIKIATAYFVPDNLTIETLLAARERGVEVEIISPAPEVNDRRITVPAARGRWGDLLEAGVMFYEFEVSLYHCKFMIIDGFWTTIGSGNFDNRSFRLNDEANLNIIDEEFARREAGVFEHDKSRSRQVTMEQWRNRPWSARAAEIAASTIRAQL